MGYSHVVHESVTSEELARIHMSDLYLILINIDVYSKQCNKMCISAKIDI